MTAEKPTLPLEDALRALLNSYSVENRSNTPDFILAEVMFSCLVAFENATRAREKWYGRLPDSSPFADLPAKAAHEPPSAAREPRLTPEQARAAKVMRTHFEPIPCDEDATGPDPNYFDHDEVMGLKEPSVPAQQEETMTTEHTFVVAHVDEHGPLCWCGKREAEHRPIEQRASAPTPEPKVDLVSRRHEGAGISVERSSAGSSKDAPTQQRSAGPSVEPQSETAGLLTRTGDEINPPEPSAASADIEIELLALVRSVESNVCGYFDRERDGSDYSPKNDVLEEAFLVKMRAWGDKRAADAVREWQQSFCEAHFPPNVPSGCLRCAGEADAVREERAKIKDGFRAEIADLGTRREQAQEKANFEVAGRYSEWIALVRGIYARLELGILEAGE